MNPGRSVPRGNETTRQFISDLDAKILADAYGYSVSLPSNLKNSAFASLDEQTGVLLVQGRPHTDTNHASQNNYVDNISIFLDGPNFSKVITNVNGFFEEFPANQVQRIVVAGNFGNDIINVASGANLAGSTSSGTLPNGTTLFGISTQVQYVVSSNADSATLSAAGRYKLDQSSTIPGAQVTLRSAMLDAMFLNGTTASPTTSRIYIPRGNYRLTETSGTDTGIKKGDLDITSGNNLSIIGSGPGATIIDAGANAVGTIAERVFDVGSGGTLNLERLTVTGGFSTVAGEHGGGLMVRSNAGAILNNVAVTNNNAFTGAGAIWNDGSLSLTSSVVADNIVTDPAGFQWYTGGINHNGATSTGPLTLASTIVANNNAFNTNTLGHDLIGAGTGLAAMTGAGSNRLESVSSAVATAYPSGTNNNLISPIGAGRVVTTVVDAWAKVADANGVLSVTAATSIREAVHAANLTTTVDDEIWLPAWTFMLTRNRPLSATWDSSGTVYSDVDVFDTLTIKGIAGFTKMGILSPTIADRVFELIGDYNSDGVVNSADYTIWSTTFGSTTDSRADANDDGMIDAADYTWWSDHVNNALTITGVTTINGAVLT